MIVNKVKPPQKIILHKLSRTVEIEFSGELSAILSAEYLRVFSPSADVRGHGNTPGQLVVGKQNVAILMVEPVGHYAIKFIFSDGHRTGIYSWDTLYNLCVNQEVNWQQYLGRIKHGK
jgi:DUF971 family protein